jgi:hypothetical protein
MHDNSKNHNDSHHSNGDSANDYYIVWDSCWDVLYLSSNFGSYLHDWVFDILNLNE